MTLSPVRRLGVAVALSALLGAVGPVLPGSTSPADEPSGALTVVALGDSVPAGAACACAPFPVRVASGLGPSAVARDLARDGQTTRGLLTQLSEPPTARTLAGAGVVIVTVGANDFDEGAADEPRCVRPLTCFAHELDELGPAVDRVLDRVGTLVRRGTPVVVTGYWNVFRDGVVGAQHGQDYVAASAALTQVVDARLAAAAGAAGAQYADLRRPFLASGDVTRLLARDGDHPNDRGHGLIAAQLVPMFRRRLG